MPDETCPSCEPMTTRSSSGVTVRRFTPESAGPMPASHIMASMHERLLNHRPNRSVVESMRASPRHNSFGGRVTGHLQLPSPASAIRELSESGLTRPHTLGQSVLTHGPLAGSSLNGLGIHLTDYGPQIGKGNATGPEGEEVFDPEQEFDPYELEEIAKEAEANRRKAEAEAKAAAEAKAQAEAEAKLRAEREKDPRWRKYWAHLAELKQIKDKCLEDARAAHVARDEKIGDDLDTCLFFEGIGLGVAGGAGGAALGGPWGALGGALAGGTLGALHCFHTAAKARADSLLELAEDEKKCNDAYENAVKKLEVPRG